MLFTMTSLDVFLVAKQICPPDCLANTSMLWSTSQNGKRFTTEKWVLLLFETKSRSILSLTWWMRGKLWRVSQLPRLCQQLCIITENGLVLWIIMIDSFMDNIQLIEISSGTMHFFLVCWKLLSTTLESLQNNNKMNFLKEVELEIIRHFSQSNTTRKDNAKSVTFIRFDHYDHWPEETNKGSCVLCLSTDKKSNTSYQCSKCKVKLHVLCFQKYHVE